MNSRRKNIVLNIVALVAILVLAASCQHKDLCYYHPHTTPITIKINWKNTNNKEITQITPLLYNAKIEKDYGDNFPKYNINEMSFELEEGSYDIAVFNGSTEKDHNNINFYLTDYNSASVKAKEVSEDKVSLSPDKYNIIEYNVIDYDIKANDTYIVSEPDWIARGLKENINISRDMVETSEKEFMKNGKSRDNLTKHDAGEIIPDSLTCTLKLRVMIKGIDYFETARAFVSGLAIGKHIVSMQPLNETASYFAPFGTFKRCGESPDGIQSEIEGSIRCFGLPEKEIIKAEDVLLTLEILLRDEETVVTLNGPLKIGNLIKKEEGTNNLYMTAAIWFPQELPYVDPKDKHLDLEPGVGLEEWERVEIEILGKK